MSGPERPPASDRLLDLLEEGAYDEAVAHLRHLGEADTATRKRALQSLRSVAEERPTDLCELADPLASFLSDEDRAVRLTTAKLLVTLAESNPETVLPAVDVLSGRLADEAEFRYVRARCAEVLGYVAVDSPDAVADPETLADLRVGLSFAGPEVTEKLAKALEYVALGDPDRLRHQVASLADHLDDENELVRYHLCTALVVVGCAHPTNLADVEDAIRARVTDESPYVRGRAAEALGVLAAADVAVAPCPDADGVDPDGDDPPPFLTDRLRFWRRAHGPSGSPSGRLGTVESVREGTADVVESMTTADDDGCPRCGLALPDGAAPMCPRCGRPQ